MTSSGWISNTSVVLELLEELAQELEELGKTRRWTPLAEKYQAQHEALSRAIVYLKASAEYLSSRDDESKAFMLTSLLDIFDVEV
jgi:hypothetical protein